MYVDRKLLLDRIKDGDKVLDIGGWDDIFPRADVVIDLNPYETRQYREHGFKNMEEKFNKDTWVRGDVCDIEVWDKFKDKEFDFVTCGHVFEDIRDPIFLARQLNRISKAGYIEFPSRFRECAKANNKDLVNGYDHHRWIIDVIDGDIVCTPKLHWANFIDYIGDERRDCLNAYQFHFTGVFWDRSFNCYERFPKGEVKESANILFFYDNYDYKNGKFIYEVSNGKENSKVKLSSLYVDQYKLPLEEAGPDVEKKYIKMFEEIKNRLSEAIINH